MASDMMSYYTGNQPGNSAKVGLLPSPYYWLVSKAAHVQPWAVGLTSFS